MDEQEWLKSPFPRRFINCLEHLKSRRKLLLFACLCARRVWHLLPDARTRRAVETLELHADGLATREELRAAAEGAWQADEESHAALPPPHSPLWQAGGEDEATRCYFCGHQICMALWDVVTGQEARYVALDAGDAALPEVGDDPLLTQQLSELFGNPFRAVCIDPAWRTPTAVTIAQAAYEESSPHGGPLDADRLSILADALEDAGCTDPDILSHCRGPGPHVRGCWVVDLLLAKE
jgi:hypothetical protein